MVALVECDLIWLKVLFWCNCLTILNFCVFGLAPNFSWLIVMIRRLTKSMISHRVNSPNSGCLPNIGYGPLSGSSIYNGTKGRKVAHQFVMRPKAAKRLFIVLRVLYPVFGKHPEFGEFTLSCVHYIFLFKSVFPIDW